MRTLLSLLLTTLTLAGVGLPRLVADDTARPREFRVAGYLPDYRWGEVASGSFDGLTDLILFSAELEPDGSLNLGRFANCPWETLRTFKTRHRVRLSLAIGGWGRSAHFAEVAVSEPKRQRFVEEVVRVALENRLDGVDLDWEHPRGVAEEEAYGRLLADLQAAFRPLGLMLTVTVAGWQGLPRTAIHAVDAVQVMAYDHDGEHSTLAGARRDVDTLLQRGVPPGKIVLGLPFYGRDVETREARTYRDIVAQFRPEPGTDRIGRMYFNGPETLRRKVAFALDARLGGVMVWELGQDASGDHSLLRAVLGRETTQGRSEAGTPGKDP